jgi:hypothetical protein
MEWGLGAVMRMKGEERSLRSLAGLKPSRYEESEARPLGMG